MVRWIVLVFCSIGLLMTGCDGSNCANPNPDYDPTDPTSESCLVVCEAGTYRCSQSNLERCKDDGSGYEFVTACPAGEACFQGTCIDESKVPEQTLIGGEGRDHEEHDHAHEGEDHTHEGEEHEEEGDEHAHEGEEHAHEGEEHAHEGEEHEEEGDEHAHEGEEEQEDTDSPYGDNFPCSETTELINLFLCIDELCSGTEEGTYSCATNQCDELWGSATLSGRTNDNCEECLQLKLNVYGITNAYYQCTGASADISGWKQGESEEGGEEEGGDEGEEGAENEEGVEEADNDVDAPCYSPVNVLSTSPFSALLTCMAEWCGSCEIGDIPSCASYSCGSEYEWFLSAEHSEGCELCVLQPTTSNISDLFDQCSGTSLGSNLPSGVMGIDLMNEPVVLKDLDPTKSGLLDAFHVRVSDAIREVAPALTLVFEPNSIRNFTDAWAVAAPFPFDDAVYSPHVYTDVFTDGWANRDIEKLQQSIIASEEEANDHGTPLLIGEYGNSPVSETGLLWLETALAQMDAERASGAVWLYEEQSQGSWGLYDAVDGERGEMRDAFAALISRPFPQAVDGKLVQFSFDMASKVLTVEVEEAGSGEHILSAPAVLYPDGVEVRCDGAVVDDAVSYPGRVGVVCTGTELTMRPAASE